MEIILHTTILAIWSTMAVVVKARSPAFVAMIYLYAAINFFVCILVVNSVFLPIGWSVLIASFTLTSKAEQSVVLRWLIRPLISNLGFVLLFLGYVRIYLQYRGG
ncbi:hypothetical protein [Alkalimonas sp.]|uniref:hypothetical protein n=1 Tax=Alkalimonas sp. TaxID=1872453 RepID=UPI00263B5625|nr:hypothetical protein [Alkalimonas sp.]MCC5826375.1 hypothetical protein [Alkalimonas sp.]